MTALQSVWGWEPALYLFLGGLGAGTFVAAAVAWLCGKAHKKTIAIGMWSAVACLCVGLGLLVIDLVKPFLALAMWQSFSNLATSWMAIGAWVLFAAVIVFALCASLLTFKRFETCLGLANVLAGLGIVLGLGVAAYTGILLKSAQGVPFWNTWLLPCLFTISAVDTGVALMSILYAVREPLAKRTRRAFEVATILFVLLEIAALAWFLLFMNAGGEAYYHRFAYGIGEAATASASMLISGQLAVAFWGLVVVLGLALPLFVALVKVLGSKKTVSPDSANNSEANEETASAKKDVLVIVGASGALVGGCALRFVVLLAGTHASIVLETIANVL